MKVALLGYGKMGRAIEAILLERNSEVLLKTTSAQTLDTEILRKCEVAIEFSTPGAAFDNIASCLNVGIPVVSGTTGWLDKYDDAVKLCYGVNGSLLYASNFSVGVNILFKMNREMAKLMGKGKSYNVQIEEIHHKHKKDAPSGTAITLANDIIANHERKTSWVNKPSKNLDELVILSVRENEVPGTHMIKYESEADQIELKHTAKGRKGFAEGAILAAEWIIGKHGVFNMQDVLGL